MKISNLPDTPLSPAQIEELRGFDSPTIANALELLTGTERDRRSGIMAPRIKSLFPDMKPLVGYASTLLFSARRPPVGKLYANREDYWRYVLTVPEPRVSVGQDLDPAPSAGAIWGEVQTNIHIALGCKGVILDGAIRDLEPLQALGYPCFARDVVVGHAYSHLVDFGVPVEVGDVVVLPGDLIHADRHGVIIIPHQFATRVAEMCRRIISAEGPLIAFCKDKEHFSIDGLITAYKQFTKDYPDVAPPSE